MEDNKELMEMDEEITLSYQDDEEEEKESEITEVSLGQAIVAASIVGVVGYGLGKGAEIVYHKVAPKVKGFFTNLAEKHEVKKKSKPIEVEATDVDDGKES